MSVPSTVSAQTVLPPQPSAVAEPAPLPAQSRPPTKPRMLYVDNLRIVLISFVLGGITIMGLLKWLWVAPLALALSFLLAHGVRQLPVARDVL